MLIPFISQKQHPDLFKLGANESTLNAISRLSVASDITVELPSSVSLADQLTTLKSLVRFANVRVGPLSATDVDVAVEYLDAAVASVIFDVDLSIPISTSSEELESLFPNSLIAVAEAISSLPSSRIFVRFLCSESVTLYDKIVSVPPEILAAMQVLKSSVVGVILPVSLSSFSLEGVKSMKNLLGKHFTYVFELDSPISSVDVGRLHSMDVQVCAQAVCASNNDEVAALELEGILDIGTCLTRCVRSDRPDGLFTTVVSDEVNHVLGLVYSSTESLIEAIRCGRGVYYSRSRQGLWRKGDTSGNYQELISIRVDCDSDAILFKVRQMGSVAAFCHLNTRTCWGEEGGLSVLERTLADRLVNAPVGSYTKRLFDDEVLLRNKLLEEAQELSEATEHDDVAAEAADLFYFALVRCAKAGVTIKDIEGHLDRRALKIRRRPGNSKEYRIAAAKAYLDSIEKK